jgi:amino-acid N-acetyltransferase
LKELERAAARAGAESVFVLTTGTADWFRQHGFVLAELSDLPVLRQQIYNQQRNSLVLSKRL